MAELKLQIPDGTECTGCKFKERREDVPFEDYHCAIFHTRAVHKTKLCLDNSVHREKAN